MFGMKGVGAIKLLPTTTYSTTTASPTGVDLQGYVAPGANSMLKAWISVYGPQTASSVAVKLQDNTTSLGSDGSWADIVSPTTAAITTLTGTAGSDTELHFTTQKRYVRAVLTVGTTATAFALAAVVLAEKRVQ